MGTIFEGFKGKSLFMIAVVESGAIEGTYTTYDISNGKAGPNDPAFVI